MVLWMDDVDCRVERSESNVRMMNERMGRVRVARARRGEAVVLHSSELAPDSIYHVIWQPKSLVESSSSQRPLRRRLLSC